MNTWKLTVEYEGTRYSGWQEQRNARTVQGALRAAVEEALGERVELGGSGRTDAGVHALAQVAHLRTGARVSPREFQFAVNDRLPQDVNLLSAEPAPRTFHARHHASARSYLYQVSLRRTAFGKRFVWWVKDPLDLEAVSRAAGLFAGRHDFASFCERPEEQGSTVVVVEESRAWREGDLLLYRVVASHFLWKMVRRLVGTLAAVGRGQMRDADLERLLSSRSRETAALTAPPSGLFLERVYYGDERGPRSTSTRHSLALPGV